MNQALLGIDMGGTGIKVSLLTPARDLIESFHWSLPTESTRELGHKEWARIFNKGIGEIRDNKNIDILSVGISTPGIPNKEHTSITFIPGRLQELSGLNWSDVLDFDGHIPIINDAKAAILGEMNSPGFIKTRNALMLTLGTGVGGAALVDGNLLEGFMGRAGHFGHLSLDINGESTIAGIPGGMDVLIGNCFIKERTRGLFSNPKELAEGFENGHILATEYWLKMVKALAVGICSLINLFDPEYVIIGGGIANASEILFSPLKEYVDLYEWRLSDHRVKIIPAQQGDFAGSIGAAIYGYDNRMQNE